MDRVSARGIILVVIVFIVLATGSATAGEPADSARDTTKIEIPPAFRDSILEQTKDDVDEIWKFIRGEEADTADTIEAIAEMIMPPLMPRTGFARYSSSFAELAALPHTSFSDHLLQQPEFDAFAATEYGTERRYLYHGLQPLAVNISIDGAAVDPRRPGFPQRMAPDLMVMPPFMFSSITALTSGVRGRPGECLAVATLDSVVGRPYSDFFVRRGDYGLSLTQGRLYRPLPGGRMANVGFSFAQSDGRSRYAAGNNRYLFAKLISPVYKKYNLAAEWRQYRNTSDIQTAEDFQRYHFQRDDLNWRLAALLFRGNHVYAPWLVRFAYDHNKYQIKGESSAALREKWGEYASYMNKSRAEMNFIYLPQSADTNNGRQAGVTLALDEMSIGADRFRRPAYAVWIMDRHRVMGDHAAHFTFSLGGNDDDAPAPEFSGGWRFTPADAFTLELGLCRQRIVPALADREWPSAVAVFENTADQVFTYSETGEGNLVSWWSNSAVGEVAGRPGRRVSIGLQGWASYEQDYYYWTDVAPADTDLAFQPFVTDARTAGAALRTSLVGPGPFATRIVYSFKRAEDITGNRLPEYIDHKVTAITNVDLTVSKFNLELHGAVEFMYWRAPAIEYTAYERRDIFRTDVLGSATIKDFTIYWLAQNVFNYGYRRAPGYDFLGRTIMWGLHLRFFN